MTTSHWNDELERLLGSARDRDPLSLIKEITDLARAMGEYTAESVLETHPALFDHSPWLTPVNDQRVLAQEDTDTEALLEQSWQGKQRFTDMASPTAMTVYNRVGDMFDAIDFNGCHRLVMVGCGGLPETIFHIHDRTDVEEIIGVDVRPEAIDSVRELTRRLGYERIRAELHDGASYDYGRAQIVYVASMVRPKAVTVSRILDTAPDSLQLVVREPYSLGRLWTDSLGSVLDSRLKITGHGCGSWNLTRDTYFARWGGRPGQQN